MEQKDLISLLVRCVEKDTDHFCGVVAKNDSKHEEMNSDCLNFPKIRSWETKEE